MEVKKKDTLVESDNNFMLCCGLMRVAIFCKNAFNE
jgi:hypothetical protein